MSEVKKRITNIWYAAQQPVEVDISMEIKHNIKEGEQFCDSVNFLSLASKYEAETITTVTEKPLGKSTMSTTIKVYLNNLVELLENLKEDGWMQDGC